MATSSHSTETRYFPCPAGVDVADHVTLKLCPTNYLAWKQLMVAFLRDQKLIGFVDGTIGPMNKPPSPQRESWEEKSSIQEETNAELKRQEDWENELQLDAERMPEPLRKRLEEWKLEQKRVKEWEADREENLMREREQSQEWVQKLRETMKLKPKMEIWQESDQEEERRRQHEQQRRRWEQLQEKILEMEQKCREEWKRKWDEKCKENVEAKELGQKLDLEAKDRNKWHRELECGQKENWERRNEWESGEKGRLLNREENRKYTDWKRSDGLVMGWVKATVTEEILVQVIHLKTAREVWIKLEKIFIPPFRVTSRAEQIDWTNQSTGKKVSRFTKLHRAILTVEWKNAEKFLKEEPDAVLQPITWSLETALMVAVRSDRQNNFVKELITRTVWESKRKACIKGTGQEIMVGTEQMDPEQKRMEIMLQEIMTGIEGNEWKSMERILQERRNIMERRMKGIESMEEEEQIESRRKMEQIEQMEVQMKDRIDQEMRNKIRGEMEQERMMIMWEDIRTQSVPLLGETDVSGATALHAAVEGGNMDAVKWLLCKNLQLANIEDTNGTLAVHVAARLGNKEIVEFLRPLTTNLRDDKSGHKLLHFLASSELYDIASAFLRVNPRMSLMNPSPLVVLAQNRHSFFSGTNLNCFQRLIYSVIRLEAEGTANHTQGEEIELGEISNRPQVGVTAGNRPQAGESERDTANHHQEGDIENPTKCKCCKWSNCCKCVDHPQERDIENPAECMCKFCEFVASSLICVLQKLNAVRQKLNALLFSVVAEITAVQIKFIRETKLTNHQALELVKCLCNNIVELDFPNAAELFTEPLMNATCTGTHEIIAEILDLFPGAVHIRNETDKSLFHLAIVYRQESIFNLIYQMEEANRRMFLSKTDASRNNGLHLAGELTVEQQLSLRASIAGAAQQMQRELQWFKEVEKFVLHADKKLRNIEGKTPQEVFIDTHKNLATEGEKWMKDTAGSCSIVAALITTIVFAAAISIPGGYGIEGLPYFLGNRAFTLFNVSNALAMLSSSASLLAFLSVLTCRYAQEDFLYALPRRMIIGQVTLFLAIISMMVAFAATLKVVSGKRKAWIVISVGVSCGVPITVFAFFQFKLFLAMIKSTFFPGIFKKQSSCRRVLT